jgi:hypothetical protein
MNLFKIFFQFLSNLYLICYYEGIIVFIERKITRESVDLDKVKVQNFCNNKIDLLLLDG